MDLDRDPTPGDPEEIRQLSEELQEFADDVGEALGRIRGMASDRAVQEWAGLSAEAFRAEFDGVPGNLDKLQRSYDMAADALARYWPELQTAQGMADRALQRAIDAQAALSSAQTDLSDAQSWVSRAGDEAERLQEDSEAPEPPDETQVRQAVRDHQAAQEAASSAQSRVDNAEAELSAARELARQALEMREEAARTCAQGIDEASDAGIQNRRWWERAIDWVVDNWDTIVSVCRAIVAVLGIVVMIIGGPLAWVVLAAALVVLADTLIDYANGRASLWDVAFASLDCIPGMRGLTTLGGLARGARGAMAAARTGLRGMAGGMRRLAGRARTAVDDAVQGTYDRMRSLIRRGDSDPVDMATGRMFLPQTDVTLPGTLPLTFIRRAESGFNAGFWFGPSWCSTLDQRLEVDERGIVMVTDDGMLLTYPHPGEDGGPVLPDAGPRWPLTRLTGEEDGYALTDPITGHTRHFSPPTNTGLCLLLRISDRNGNTIEIDYDEWAAPTALRHSGGYRLAITTDGHRVTALALTEPTGETPIKTYGYTDGNLTEITNSSGRPLHLAYDTHGNITSWTDTNGHSYTYAYDDQHRCTAQGGQAGHFTNTLTYNATDPAWPDARITTLTTAQGATTRYVINDRSDVIAETDPLGHTTRTEYDDHHHITAQTDALGHTTRFINNAVGQPLSVLHPDGGVTCYDYNESYQPVAVQFPDGSTIRYSWDERGNCAAVTDPIGETRRFAYDQFGGLRALILPDGSVTRIQCNAAGVPVEMIDPLGNRTVREVDAFGRETALTAPDGATTRTWWDGAGRMVRRLSPEGAEETWRYDGEGNCVLHSDANGSRTIYEYGPFDTLVARTDPGGRRQTFTYDGALRVRRVTDSQGLSWDYTYDPVGRLVTETNFDGRRFTYERDAVGRVTARTNPLGQTTHYRRDPSGRVVEKRADGILTSYAYDALGRLTTADSPDAHVVLEYDAVGRVLSESCNGRVLRHDYDAAGRRVRRVTPSGAISMWEFDAAGRPTMLTTSGQTVAFEWDPVGRETSRRVADSLTLTQSWTPSGRLAGQAVTPASASAYARVYDYRPDGYLASVITPGGPCVLDLDPAGRVTAVRDGEWTEHYTYDESGNQMSAEWPTRQGYADARGDRTYDGTLLTRAGQVRYEHDNAGRVTVRRRSRLSRRPDIWRYVWDAEDRLSSVVTPDGAEWRYRYDGLGRRIAKERLADDGSGHVVERIDFIWDGTALVEQLITRAPEHPVVALTWDHDGLRTLTQIERLVRPCTQEEIDRRFFSIVTDVIGTPTELISEQGEIAWRRRSTLWGITAWAKEASTFTPLRFPGQYYDPESGLHYNYHRYYSPETARYLSPDPMGLAPAPNPMAYVHNPHTWLDPLGLMACEHPAITETRQGAGSMVSQHPMTADEALQGGIDFLGDGYRELGQNRGVFRSADGLRQFRMDQDSLQGNHWPDVPHVHFEMFRNPGDKRPFVNNHVPLVDPRRPEGGAP
ncbi:RHS repeat-associated core domain-containing protein [Streptomyces sp. DSM 44917]|uniref:RHS repeat-associated core domain-containing protein n=1 Tax=Streptomyces boetiae TaxID=3075541 RepID=A0ABU2L1M7_9ACTN|nr:RHS repeat-associated core domain-containing protein [Streptomyces sp. DSM 44917]MDT0305459.1 RHS repeat-associated core domain-containing protein [Streptomyces sp. DSM 44917]